MGLRVFCSRTIGEFFTEKTFVKQSPMNVSVRLKFCSKFLRGGVNLYIENTQSPKIYLNSNFRGGGYSVSENTKVPRST